MSKAPWFTNEESARLSQLWLTGARSKIVERILGRTRCGIAKRVKKIGLPGLRAIRQVRTEERRG